jgi:putative ABC transport system permease protein
MKKLDIRLLRMIKHSKGQFISVTVIVAAALCIYVLFNITSINIKNAAKDYYNATNINDIHVQLVKLPSAAIDDLKSIEGIKEVQGRISFDVPLRVRDKDEKVQIRILSLPGDNEKINKLYPSNNKRAKLGNDNAILIEQFAKARNISPGDYITPYINGKVHNLKVSNIASSSEFVYLMENEQSLMPAAEKFGVVYVSEEFAQSAYGYKGSYNELLITVKDGSRIDDIVDVVEKRLDKYGIKRITKLEDQISNKVLTEKMDGIDKMANTIPVLFLMVAAIIIAILLSRVVNNDRIAIGVLKALGYSNLRVLFHYAKYAMAIGIIGSAVGITGGILLSGPLSQVFVSYFNIPLTKIDIYYAYIAKAIALTSSFCILSGLWGSRTALGILPADSMRPEVPRSGKRIFLEKISFIWSRLSFSWKMVIRNILRTKRRFILLVLGLSLTYGINTVPLYEADAMPAMFELQYGEYQKMDYTINFTHPMNKSIVNDIKHLIDTSRVEGKLEYPFELKNGWYKKAVNIIGVEANTSFYKFVDVNNKEVKLKENGIFITEALAKTLNIKQGDKIIVKNFLPGKKDVVLEVNSVIRQYLGINAYMNIKEMQNLLIDKEMITGVNLDSKDNVKEKLEDIKNISSVSSVGDMKNSFMQFLDTLIIATRFYMLFGGILGFAIIYNSTIIGISERNMEFASLRVMGFDKKDIFRMISRENFLMAGIAILLGIPLGLGMIKGIAQSFSSEMITFPLIFSPRIFIYAAIATVFFVIIAQLATLKKVYNLNFIDALKSRIS